MQITSLIPATCLNLDITGNLFRFPCRPSSTQSFRLPSKMLNVLIKTVAFAGALAAVVFYILISNSRDDLKRELIENRNAALSAEKERDQALSDIVALNHKMGAMNSDLEAKKTKAASLQRQNLQARREISKLGEELKSADEERHKWENETQSLKRQLLSAGDDSQKELGYASADYEARIFGLRENIVDLQDELENYRSNSWGIPGPSSNSPVNSDKFFEGTILDIGPQNSVVALNIGVEQGARQGMKLTLRQSNGSQAQVLLTIVRPVFSIGYILADSGKLNELKKGRKITIILP